MGRPSGIDSKLAKNCAIIDQPAGTPLNDLKQRGLLDFTPVVRRVEFGRTPLGQLERVDEAAGRDRHADCFTIWMAGGIRRGQVIGKTDHIGLGVIDDPVRIHDWQATTLTARG